MTEKEVIEKIENLCKERIAEPEDCYFKSKFKDKELYGHKEGLREVLALIESEGGKTATSFKGIKCTKCGSVEHTFDQCKESSKSNWAEMEETRDLIRWLTGRLTERTLAPETARIEAFKEVRYKVKQLEEPSEPKEPDNAESFKPFKNENPKLSCLTCKWDDKRTEKFCPCSKCRDYPCYWEAKEPDNAENCPECGEKIRHLYNPKTGEGDGGECACTDKKEPEKCVDLKCPECKNNLEMITVSLYKEDLPFFAYVCPTTEAYKIAREKQGKKTCNCGRKLSSEELGIGECLSCYNKSCDNCKKVEKYCEEEIKSYSEIDPNDSDDDFFDGKRVAYKQILSMVKKDKWGAKEQPKKLTFCPECAWRLEENYCPNKGCNWKPKEDVFENEHCKIEIYSPKGIRVEAKHTGVELYFTNENLDLLEKAIKCVEKKK